MENSEMTARATGATPIASGDVVKAGRSLCFIVEGSDDPEDTMVVFARSHIEAKRRWANVHGDGDKHIAGISAKRAKGWDQYAPGPVPPLAMIDGGWWFECSGCGVRICDDDIGQPVGYDDAESDEEAAALPIMAPVEHGRRDVYCHQDCLDRELADRARKKHYRDRIIAWMDRRVLRRFPDATIIVGERTWDRHAHITTNEFGRLRVEQVVVAFTWPTSRIGPAHLRIDSQSMGRKIPRNAHVMCCAGDKEAFEAWAEQQKTLDVSARSAAEVPSRTEGVNT